MKRFLTVFAMALSIAFVACGGGGGGEGSSNSVPIATNDAYVVTEGGWNLELTLIAASWTPVNKFETECDRRILFSAMRSHGLQ